MYKLTIIVLMMTIWLMLHVMQTDEEIAMKTLFQGKHALNRAVHAAAQQVDKAALGDGVVRIDPLAAEASANRYLQGNLQLDAAGKPLGSSLLKEPVKVVVFDVINNEHTFPYQYVNAQYSYEATLRRPGVVMIIKLVNPSVFTALKPIEWTIKGVSELTFDF
ncbi:hypothetical protein SAMN04487969_12371 [Paenibacillus algorifonticola]|uniref:Uncharacterized protein n=1 Tax=Paenibacillus algorifonticola TaxID=684063 RepID=A0A1I2HKB5_9BACL|nr:hypothetical protein [Paenibacillus algorifonticola]SFF29196.1 hypothetical protein SAMN04487969_12371 [Paenibacillus algorifonticola]